MASGATPYRHDEHPFSNHGRPNNYLQETEGINMKSRLGFLPIVALRAELELQ